MLDAERTEIVFEIIESYGVLATYSTGWTKEINLISWNGGQPKIDIRDWDQNHEHMSRGVTLHQDEAKKMLSFLNKHFKNK